MGKQSLQTDEANALKDYHTAYDAYSLKRDAALAGTQTDLAPLQQDLANVQTAMVKLIQVNRQFADLSNDDAQSVFSQMRSIMIALGLVLSAITMIVALVIARTLTSPLGKTLQMLEEMGKGHLGKRLGMQRRDEIGVLAAALDRFADDLQTRVVGTMKKISNGDLTANVDSIDEQDEISPALRGTTLSLRGLVAETITLTQAAVEGNLAARADASKFQGDYRQIMQGINDTLDAVISPLNVAADYVDRISKGDVPAKITDKYNGDFNEIKNNLNQCVDAVNALPADVNLLSKASSKGVLSVRADATRHTGEFRRIVEGMNATFDQMLVPINDTKQTLGQVARGDLT